MMLFIFTGLMFLFILLCSIPEFKMWVFVRRQNPARYTLKVHSIKSLNNFLARDMYGLCLFDIQCSTEDYKRPPYDVGTIVYVRGKRGCKRKGGYQLLVDCFVTIPRSEIERLMTQNDN